MIRVPLVRLVALGAAVLVGVVAAAAAPAAPDGYTVTALVSNQAGVAPTTDPHLVNAWGLTASATSPWWVSDNGANLSTLYNAAGTKIPLEVTVKSAPTGVVANSVPTSFIVGTRGANFIFDTEEGKILGWNSSVVTTAQVKVDNSAAGAIYKGLAYAITATGPQLYAADFGRGEVDVYDGQWNLVTTTGGFVDPKLPNGYAPFGIQTIGSRIYVAYAKSSGGIDEMQGQGLGVVDAFDFDGNFLVRVAQHGQLNAPWGLAQAPAAGFGPFSGDLLVGNFGDGNINAYEEQSDGTFERVGGLRDSRGRQIAIDGLWALEFGHGAVNNGPTNTLFFTAGPNDENDGLFGKITAD